MGGYFAYGDGFEARCSFCGEPILVGVGDRVHASIDARTLHSIAHHGCHGGAYPLVRLSSWKTLWKALTSGRNADDDWSEWF